MLAVDEAILIAWGCCETTADTEVFGANPGTSAAAGALKNSTLVLFPGASLCAFVQAGPKAIETTVPFIAARIVALKAQKVGGLSQLFSPASFLNPEQH